MKKRIAILGSTGSIGTQALDVIRQHPDDFEVEVLAARSSTDLLISQAIEFQPNFVIIADDNCYTEVKDALSSYPVKVFSGEKSVSQIVQDDNIDMVLVALVGFSGLIPALEAIKAGKEIALANKESLVVAGELLMKEAFEKKVQVLPVDSEHSAIFQCLSGEYYQSIEKLILTASGGPFRTLGKEELLKVTPEDALKHPNWVMGNKITIDSASLMNKGLEVIEAHWLFGVSPENIEVVIHPQSIVHSLVQFRDGSLKAQLGLPDMRLPILYAFTYPQRFQTDFPRFSFLDYPELTFEKADTGKFRNLALAYTALSQGGNMPCIMNAANEIAVGAFLDRRVDFMGMPGLIEKCMQKIPLIIKPGLDDLIETDREARRIMEELILHYGNTY